MQLYILKNSHCAFMENSAALYGEWPPQTWLTWAQGFKSECSRDRAWRLLFSQSMSSCSNLAKDSVASFISLTWPIACSPKRRFWKVEDICWIIFPKSINMWAIALQLLNWWHLCALISSLREKARSILLHLQFGNEDPMEKRRL